MSEKQSEADCQDSTNSSSSIALTMMQQELPQYIQNIFMATGYETLHTIAEMDVKQSSEPNDIDRMLVFIKQHFPNDARFFRADYVSSELYIPPGHRNAICHFVTNVKKS